jgi:hypothetical protein
VNDEKNPPLPENRQVGNVRLREGEDFSRLNQVLNMLREVKPAPTSGQVNKPNTQK